MNRTVVGILCGLGAASIWGGMYVVSKVVLEIIPPFSLVTLRLLLGAITLVIVLFIRGFPNISRRQIWQSVGRWLCRLWNFSQSAIFRNEIIYRSERIVGHICHTCVCIALRLDVAWREHHSTPSPGFISGDNGCDCSDRPAFCSIESGSVPGKSTPDRRGDHLGAVFRPCPQGD